MKIYTKTGDEGTTSLIGGRVEKDNLRVETYGTVDELMSSINVLMLNCDSEVKVVIKEILEDLYNINASLATININKEYIYDKNIQFIEETIDKYESKLEPLSEFIIYFESELSCYANVSRTICRRAERRVVSLAKIETIDSNIKIYLNRLSDLLFVLARYFDNK